MHQIELKYFDRRFWWGKYREQLRRVQCVETWNELNSKQAEFLALMILSDEPIEIKKTLLFSKLSNIPQKIFARLNDIQIISLYDCMDVFFEDPDLTHNLWRSVRIQKSGVSLKKHELVGPGNYFGKVTVDEFIEAEDHYFDYLAEARKAYPVTERLEEALDLLVATLWRERDTEKRESDKDFNGDFRVAFNQHHVKTRRKLVSEIPDHRKLAMLFYYQGCRQWLMNQFDDLFNETDGENGSADSDTWIKMIGHLPSEKFGTLDQIGSKNLVTSLFFCNLFVQEARDQRKKLAMSN